MARPTPLKRAIFDRGLTQRSVAAALDLREDQFSRIVNGLQCEPALQERIAEMLGCAVADLWPALPESEAA